MPQAPRAWEFLSESEKAAIRAQVYPDILDDKGREWRLGMIDDQRAEIERLRVQLAEAEECVAWSWTNNGDDGRIDHTLDEKMSRIIERCKAARRNRK